MLTHELFWQKVPSAQGVAVRAQGALTPLHSFAPQDDMSVDWATVAFAALLENPSAQTPLLHVWPMGHWELLRQGSMADFPTHLGGWLGILATFMTINKRTATAAIIASICVILADISL